MTYEEVTEYLFSQVANYEQQGASGYKEGLDTTLKLDEHFGHPHEHFRSIHIAGTNGKGSVSHSIAAILQTLGYRVGLYTSPHLIDFKERIRINGQCISEDYVVSFVEKEHEFFESLKPSFFEITTAMAFKYFFDNNIDIAVIEVGLGGRLDCTNIISPILSVITNISLDHTQLLGSSLEQIAMEKGGIIKAGIPVVIGESDPQTRPVFEAIASEMKAPIFFADDDQEKEVESAELLPEGGIMYHCSHLGNIKGELSGNYQITNTNTVFVAMHQLTKLGYTSDCIDSQYHYKVEKELNLALGNIKNLTGLMGRWQVMRTAPTVVCDTGHNPGAWEHLSVQLANVKCRQMRIVFGMLSDKDVYSVMSLLPKNATYFFTKGSTKRALPETSLKVFADQFGLKGECYPTVEKAFEAAITGATSDDFIFIGGSTYVVADFLKTRV